MSCLLLLCAVHERPSQCDVPERYSTAAALAAKIDPAGNRRRRLPRNERSVIGVVAEVRSSREEVRGVGIWVRSHRCHAVVGQPPRPTIASIAPPAPRTSIASTGDRQVGSPGLNCRLRLGDVGTIVPPAREGRRRKFGEADKRQIVEEAVRRVRACPR